MRRSTARARTASAPSGRRCPASSCRLADDGELADPRATTVFAGYYKDEEATREVLDDDGWLRTGDIGEIDADGFLTITDRKKDIIVTAGGKNVAPQNIENALKASPLVSQALVVGDRRPYVAALSRSTRPRSRAAARRGRRRREARVAGGVVDEVNARPLALRADQALRDPRRATSRRRRARSRRR